MTNYTILHNPRCSKSRQALQILKENNIIPTVIEYLKTPLNKNQLTTLFNILKCPVRECIRTNESIYKELNLKDPDLSDAKIINTISQHPILLERPIIYTSTRAIIGRPTDKIKLFLDKINKNH